MGRFINHLPMAQLALYRMTGDLDRVETYSDYFANHFSVDPLQSNYPAINSIEIQITVFILKLSGGANGLRFHCDSRGHWLPGSRSKLELV